MKVTVTKSNLIQGLSNALQIAASQSINPVLNHLLIRAGGRLTLTATDLEHTLVQEVEGDIRREGSVCVQARILHQTVKSSEEGDFSIEAGQNSWVELNSVKTNYLLAGIPEKDFAGVKIPQTLQGTVSANALITALKRVAFAISDKDYKTALTGVYVNQCELAATDGCRLSRVTVPELTLPDGLILPQKGIKALSQVFHGHEDELRWGREGNEVVFSTSATTLALRLIDGNYPNYKSILKDLTGASFIVSPEALRSQLNFCKAVGAEQVMLKGLGSAIEITAKSKEGDETSGTIDLLEGHWEGEIGFQLHYLFDPLKYAFTDQSGVELVINPRNACQIKFPDDPSYHYVVMPLAMN